MRTPPVSFPSTPFLVLSAIGTFACGSSDPVGIVDATDPGPPGPFTAVSAGTNHACALTAKGAAYCWGDNGTGELGDSTDTSRLTPVAVSGGQSFVTIDAGWFATCGLNAHGTAYCWGTRDGGGGLPSEVHPVPEAVPGGLIFATITTGWASTICGVTNTQSGYCMGYNIFGELGTGTNTDSWWTPVAVTGGLNFTMVDSRSWEATCGLTVAGLAYCWGDNGSYELGIPNPPFQSSVPVLVSGGLTFTAISVGGLHSCGLTSAGRAYCWGYHVTTAGDTITTSAAPVGVPGGLTLASLTSGGFHDCGLTSAGVAYCWGDGFMGQLGYGDTSNVFHPVRVAGGLTFAKLSAGYLFTCGVTPRGAAYCWGYNAFGQLGNGATTKSLVPVLVVSPKTS